MPPKRETNTSVLLKPEEATRFSFPTDFRLLVITAPHLHIFILLMIPWNSAPVNHNCRLFTHNPNNPRRMRQRRRFFSAFPQSGAKKHPTGSMQILPDGWWRRGGSNPCPKTWQPGHLRAQSVFLHSLCCTPYRQGYRVSSFIKSVRLQSLGRVVPRIYDAGDLRRGRLKADVHGT